MTHGNTQRNRAVMADIHRVRVGKKYWLFTFSERFGPLLTDAWGEPVNNMALADEEHPFWDAFEVWIASRHPAAPSSPGMPKETTKGPHPQVEVKGPGTNQTASKP